MRVMLVTVGLGLGGAERLIVDLAGELVRRGDDVMIVTLLDDGELLDEARASGAEVVQLGFRRGRPSPTGFARYLRVLERTRPQIVHASMFHANILARTGRLLVPTSCVISSAHNVDERGDRRRRLSVLRLRDLLYRLTDRLSEFTSQVSPTGADDYVARGLVSSDRIRFVPNGIDVERFTASARPRQELRRELGWDESERVFLCVGALTEQKNHAELIAAFERALVDDRAARLVIVGGGPLAEQLEDRRSTSPIADRIDLLGRRRDIPELLAASDVFVLPSRFEGMPLVLLEALAAGVPVIATAVGAVPEVLGPSGTGWLLPPHDLDALVAALEEVLEIEPSTLRSRGAAARSYTAARYGLEAYADRWRSLYEGLSQRAPRRLALPAAVLADEIWSAQLSAGAE